MKQKLNKTGGYARLARALAGKLKPTIRTSQTSRRAYDAVAHAAALEVLG